MVRDAYSKHVGRSLGDDEKVVINKCLDKLIQVNQASTLTLFLTCPFGQLTKKKYLSDSIF